MDSADTDIDGIQALAPAVFPHSSREGRSRANNYSHHVYLTQGLLRRLLALCLSLSLSISRARVRARSFSISVSYHIVLAYIFVCMCVCVCVCVCVPESIIRMCVRVCVYPHCYSHTNRYRPRLPTRNHSTRIKKIVLIRQSANPDRWYRYQKSRSGSQNQSVDETSLLRSHQSLSTYILPLTDDCHD